LGRWFVVSQGGVNVGWVVVVASDDYDGDYLDCNGVFDFIAFGIELFVLD
jgi:hypothetical protein